MLTVPEAARRTGKNPETIRRWIREGRLRASKIGTQHVIEDSDLDAFLGDEVVSVPDSWMRTPTGEPMPNVVRAIRLARSGR